MMTSEIELDFGFSDVDLQKIMEETAAEVKTSSPLPPTSSVPDASDVSTGTGAPKPTPRAVGDVPAAPRRETEGEKGQQQQRRRRRAREGGGFGDAAGSAQEGKDAGETGHAAQPADGGNSEASPDQELIKEITDAIEGRYLDELERRQREGDGTRTNAGSLAADAAQLEPEQVVGAEMRADIVRELEEELAKPSPDADKVRQVIRTHVVPDESLRADIWKVGLFLLPLV